MTTVKLFAALSKRPGISLQYFHDHWRHPHGTLARRISLIRRYVQSHRIETPLLPGGGHGFEGVTEVWFDNVRDALSMAHEPAYTTWLAPDEFNIVEPKKVVYVMTTEEVLCSRPGVKAYPADADGDWSPWTWRPCVKLIQLVPPSDDGGWASDEDEDLGNRIGAFRHVRSRPVPSIYQERTPKLAGARELWWPTLTAFERGVESDRAAFETLLSRGRPHTLLCLAERVK